MKDLLSFTDAFICFLFIFRIIQSEGVELDMAASALSRYVMLEAMLPKLKVRQDLMHQS